MEHRFKRRTLAESFVGKQLEAILGRQMTEKRVNGYPVPSTGLGNGNRMNGNTRQRLNALSSFPRGLSQSSMQLGQSASVSNKEPSDNNAKNSNKAKSFSKPVLRQYASVDDTHIVRPQQFRRATEKYVRPRSIFYIPSCADDGGSSTNGGQKEIKPGAPSPSTDAAETALPRWPPRRVSSFHRRSASVDDLLSSNNRNSNLMSFSSDEEDNDEGRRFQRRSDQLLPRSISVVTEAPVIRPSVVASRISVNSTVNSSNGSAAVTMTNSSGSAQNSMGSSANTGIPTASLPTAAQASTSAQSILPGAPKPVRRSRPSAIICPIFPAVLSASTTEISPLASSSPLSAVATPSSVVSENVIPASSSVISTAPPAALTMEIPLSPLIPDLVPAAATNLTVASPAAVTNLTVASPAAAKNPAVVSPTSSGSSADASTPVPPFVLATTSNVPSVTPTSTASARPIPSPRRMISQQSYLDLFLDLMPSSSTATIATVPAQPPILSGFTAQRARNSPTRDVLANSNAEPSVQTDVLVDLSETTPGPSSLASAEGTDSDIRSSSSSSRSSLAEETSVSPASAIGRRIRETPVTGSSRSLDSLPNSSPEPEVERARRASMLGPIPTRTVASTSRASSSGPDIDPCETSGSLRMYDKIVWFTENGVPETGMVKWLGRIKSTFYAGIEFENHVGNSSGKIKGRRLFTTALTKGRFVPITELMLHKDFYEGFPYPTNAPADPKIMPKAAPQKFVSSVIMCVVCQEALLNPDEDEGASVEGSAPVAAAQEQKEMIATPCGHLFHTDCLKRWFDVNQKPRQPCPYCQNLMGINEVLRIFPVQGKL